MCMYTFDVTNGRESGSEKPVAKETEIRIHVGGGEERRDENKGERKKKKKRERNRRENSRSESPRPADDRSTGKSARSTDESR